METYGIRRIDAGRWPDRGSDPNAIDVWTMDCGSDGRPPADAEDCHFSESDRERFHGLAPGHAQRTFAAGRFVLRHVLARYLGCHPRDVPIGIGERGKPYLASSECPLFFNLAHAWPLFAVAISTSGDIGVDVELASRRCDLDLIGPHVLSPSELAALRRSADPRRAFLAIWTIKEAVTKASSLGLRIDMKSIMLDVLPLADPSRRLTACVEELGTWSVTPFAVGREGIAAVATRHAHCGVRLFRQPISTMNPPFARDGRALESRWIAHGP